MKRIVLCMAVACVSGLMPPLTWAQEQAVEQESKRATEKAQRTSRRAHYPPQIFRLKHADCFEVAEVLGRVARDATALPIRRGNCIVYAGPADTLEAVRGLVEELDTPATDAEAGHLEIVKILHRNAEELADQVARILSSRDFRVAADESRSSILLRGSGYAIESALDLIKQLDTPAPGVSLEFAFFHADLNSDEDQGPIPTDLADVAKELRRFGG
ncbi:MAG: secretin N-terminal domain-containing protein, partial [Planctomycetota bacterium]